VQSYILEEKAELADSTWSSQIKEKIEVGVRFVNQMEMNESKYWFLCFYNDFQHISLKKLEKIYKNKSIKEKHKQVSYILSFLDAVYILQLKINEYIIFKQQNEQKNSTLCEQKEAELKLALKNAISHLGNNILKQLETVTFVTSCYTSAAICGAMGGTAGLMAGFFSHKRPLIGAGPGLVAGVGVGSIVGYRMLKKAVKSASHERIQRAIRQLEVYCNEDVFIRNQNLIEENLKNKWLNTYFDNDPKKFDVFLKEEHEYEILSSRAAFVSKQLKGYLGNHAFIRFTLGADCLLPAVIIEMGKGEDDYPLEEISQRERRTTSGEILLKMATFHERLKVLTQTPQRLLKYYRAGEQDCHTYLNIILSAVNEEVLQKVRRFTPNDNRVTRDVLQFFSNTSPVENHVSLPEDKKFSL